jgi:hypothetical protein
LGAIGNVDANDVITFTTNDTSADATDIVALNAKVDTFDVDSITTVTEDAATIGTNAVNVTDALAIVGTTHAVTITNAISASDANFILDESTNGTSGIVTATITADTAANLNTALADATSSDALSLTVNDDVGATDATDLTDLDGKTSGSISAISVTEVTGTSSQIDALVSSSVTMASNYDATVTGTAATSDVSNILADTTGVVDATFGGTDDTLTIDFSNLDASDNLDFAGGDDTISFSTAGSGVVDFTNLDNLENIDFANATNDVTLENFNDESNLNVTGGTSTDTFTLDFSDLSYFNSTDGIDGGAGSDEVIFTGSTSNATDGADFLGGLTELNNIETLDITGLSPTGFSGDDSIEFQITDAMIADWTGDANGNLTLQLTSDQAQDIMFTDVGGDNTPGGGDDTLYDGNANSVSDNTTYDLGNTTLTIDLQ